MIFLKATNIEKSFNKVSVLNIIDFSVNQGDIVHISGGNGSGKSTLLKILSKLMKPDRGNIEYASQLKVGSFIENPSFLEDETAMYNLRFLYNLTNERNDKVIEEWLKYFDLDPNSKKSIKHYSVGMRQKVAIIQAVMEDQNLILLDEPARGLDEESITRFEELINRLSSENKTVIICSHDNLENINYNKSFVLKDGTLHNV